MAMALLTISSLSQPVRALGRWFSRNLPNAGSQASRTSSPVASALRSATAQRGPAVHRPGLWMASPGSCVAADGCSRAAANAERFDAVAPIATLRPAASPRRTVRVVRHTNAGDPSRLMISGRMADVCAELDRLVAREAAQR